MMSMYIATAALALATLANSASASAWSCETLYSTSEYHCWSVDTAGGVNLDGFEAAQTGVVSSEDFMSADNFAAIYNLLEAEGSIGAIDGGSQLLAPLAGVLSGSARLQVEENGKGTNAPTPTINLGTVDPNVGTDGGGVGVGPVKLNVWTGEIPNWNDSRGGGMFGGKTYYGISVQIRFLWLRQLLERFAMQTAISSPGSN